MVEKFPNFHHKFDCVFGMFHQKLYVTMQTPKTFTPKINKYFASWHDLVCFGKNLKTPPPKKKKKKKKKTNLYKISVNFHFTKLRITIIMIMLKPRFCTQIGVSASLSSIYTYMCECLID